MWNKIKAVFLNIAQVLNEYRKDKKASKVL